MPFEDCIRRQQLRAVQHVTFRFIRPLTSVLSFDDLQVCNVPIATNLRIIGCAPLSRRFIFIFIYNKDIAGANPDLRLRTITRLNDLRKKPIILCNGKDLFDFL